MRICRMLIRREARCLTPSQWRVVWRKMAHGRLNGSTLSCVACDAENDQHLPCNSSPSAYTYRHIGADSAQPGGTVTLKTLNPKP